MKYLIGMVMLLSTAAGFVLTAVLSLGGCISLKNETAANTGELSSTETDGSAMGYRGMIHVRVGMDKGAITDITVIESQEDRAVGGEAIEELADLVLMYNTTELDAVSGATETSKGFLEAVENAIMKL
ncbi:MAG: FMN-binding protein [Treponema sp.]|nr:FMN-binding protein [Treponema sp.]